MVAAMRRERGRKRRAGPVQEEEHDATV